MPGILLQSGLAAPAFADRLDRTFDRPKKQPNETTPFTCAMFAPALRIALGKSRSTSDRTLLERALDAADALDLVQAAFEERINASKAARGEKPTRLSKGWQAEVDGYARDAEEIQREQLSVYEAELDPREIVVALSSGLQSDLSFWNGAAKYAHAADRPIVEELVAAKRRLLSALDTAVQGLAQGAT
ncbi:hypothetical protein ACPOLB_27080 [Rubrivivax sp. RP6-9]|uniref:hypothetical protein n=1 Tax=Rubrivivax sp. RP6-9 TaxID=3415750 RepID=UPI003CC62831